MPELQDKPYQDHVAATPLVPVRLTADSPAIWCKLEFLNPSGSTKDRIASFILRKALRRGDLKPGGWVVEASSGSTSIALALACAQLNLRFAAIMPESVSNERTLMIRSYGGEVLLTPAADGIRGALGRAEQEAQQRKAFLPRQFSNPDNPASHRYQTAQEIMRQIPVAQIDAIVSGVGTGGTLVGIYQGLADFGCRARPFAARPTAGASLGGAECCSFSSRIPGVVEGLSKIYNDANLPKLKEIEVDDSRALEVTRLLIRQGFPVGPSSGLNYQAALQAATQLAPNAQLVTVFPDRMERYFSTELFAGMPD